MSDFVLDLFHKTKWIKRTKEEEEEKKTPNNANSNAYIFCVVRWQYNADDTEYFIVKTEFATDIPKASRHLWRSEHMHYESFDKIFDLMRGGVKHRWHVTAERHILFKSTSPYTPYLDDTMGNNVLCFVSNPMHLINR